MTRAANSRPRRASAAVALALVSAACSGPTGDGGTAAPRPSTTTAPASLHDPVPVGGPAAPGSTTPTSSLPGRARTGTTTTRRGGTSTTAPSGGRATTTTAATTPPGLPPEKCPEPKTCRRYGFHGDGAHRWRTGPDGRVTIPYRINPSGSTTLTPEQIEGAFRAAFDTWGRAAPALRFVYEGRTTMQAAPGDGVSVVAFNGPTIENTTPTLDQAGFVTEFDMLYAPTGWTWAPCEQADGSCVPHNVTTSTGGYLRDLQSIATHAAGHALWLGDMEDDHDLDRYLTMYPNHTMHPPGSRFWTTLALTWVVIGRTAFHCSPRRHSHSGDGLPPLCDATPWTKSTRCGSRST